MSSARQLLMVRLALGLNLLSAWQVAAVTLNPGDILVADPYAGVIKVDPVSGERTVVSSGGLFVSPTGIAVAANGDILVVDANARAVFRVKPDTGEQSFVSAGGLFSMPFGIAIAANGEILVADTHALGGAVLRVSPVSGAQTIVSAGGLFRTPNGVAVASDGEILVADGSAFHSTFSEGGVIRVDPTTGAQTPVAFGGDFSSPISIAIESSGDILITDADAFPDAFPGSRGGLFRINRAAGSQTVLSMDGFFRFPSGVAIAGDGGILVADPRALPCFGGICSGAVIRVDPVSGEQTLVSRGDPFQDPIGIAVVPPGYPTPTRRPTWGELKARYR